MATSRATVTRRPSTDRTASVSALTDELTNIRAIRDGLRTARAGARPINVAGVLLRVEALERAVLGLTRAVLALSGVDNTADRTVGTDRS